MKSAEADGGFDFIQNAGILDFIGQSPISSFVSQKISFHLHPLEKTATHWKIQPLMGKFSHPLENGQKMAF